MVGHVDIDQIAVAAAVNDDAILAHCLARSPDIEAGDVPLSTYRGYSTAGLAYNQALADCRRPFLILAHQDVYLPKGTAARLTGAIEALSAVAPDWAVAGVIGLNEDDKLAGRTWSTGLDREISGEVPLPARAATLDEMLLVMNVAAKPVFDPLLPSFHLYGTDIVHAVQDGGHSAWVIDLPVIHNSRPVTNLGGGYRTAWNYMRRKHANKLPLPNLVCPITASPRERLVRDLRLRWRASGRVARGGITRDARAIARKLGLE